MESAGTYKIVAGVRRALAVHRQGLSTIRAVSQSSDGTMGLEFEVPIAQLYSAKFQVQRSDRGGRYLRIEQAMADPNRRGELPAIEIIPLPQSAVKYFVAIADVVLEE